MRVLFTTQPATGQLHPLVPLARALIAAEHEVRFACAPSLVPQVEASGFRCIPAGLDFAMGNLDPLVRQFPALPPRPPPGSPVSVAWTWANVFAGVAAAQMVPDLLDLARSWMPDLIMRVHTELGGCVAAEVLGIPHATAGAPTFNPPAFYQERVAAPLAALRAAHGLPPDPDLTMLYRYLDLSFAPPQFVDRAVDYVRPIVHFLRPLVFDRSGDEALPEWVASLPPQPTIYATLGTVMNKLFPTLFPVILAALGDAGVNLILTVGRELDPEQWGEQPENVHIERYIPQTLLLPACDLVVHVGGLNTTMSALGAGLPTVIIPIGADQPENARRAAALGVGMVLGREEWTPEAIRTAVESVLGDPTYRANAERVRDEMAALPGPEHAVTLLERLAREKQPILSA